MTLVLRLLGGESYLNWKAAVAYPWYDEETNTQYFPYKTMTMLIGLGVMLGVSYLTDWLMNTGRLDLKWLRYINNRADRLLVKTSDETNSSSSGGDEEEMVEVKKELIDHDHQENGKS